MGPEATTEEDVKPSIAHLRSSILELAYAAPNGTSPRRSPRIKREKPETPERGQTRASVNALEAPDSTSPKKKIKQSPSGSDPKSMPSTPTKKMKRGYAEPATYAHLNVLQDHLEAELDVMFCGIKCVRHYCSTATATEWRLKSSITFFSPGVMSARKGHHFANPNNHFWRCLHFSGLTDRLVPPSEDFTLPKEFSLGLTNLVDRPSAQEAELSKQEMMDSVPAFLAKVAKHRPRIVCFVGRGIWLIVEKAFVSKTGKNGKDAARRCGTKDYGLQPYRFVHPADPQTVVRETLFFCSPSSSGRVTSHQIPEKTKLFEELGQNVQDHKSEKIDTSMMIDVTGLSL